MNWLVATPLACAVHPPPPQRACQKFQPPSTCIPSAHALPHPLRPLQVSYMILQRVSPVTHSIGNSVKRVVVIASSILVFRNPVGAGGVGGRTRAAPTSSLCCHWHIIAFLGLARIEQACTPSEDSIVDVQARQEVRAAACLIPGCTAGSLALTPLPCTSRLQHLCAGDPAEPDRYRHRAGGRVCLLPGWLNH